MGNYVTPLDIVDQKGLPEATINAIITAFEESVEYWCQRIFYKNEGYVVKFRGNAKTIQFFPGLYNIISVTSIHTIDSDDTETLIPASNYGNNTYSVFKKAGGLWTRRVYPTYKITCDVGHDTLDANGNTDKFYKPNGIVEAIKMLVVNALDTAYGTTSGTSTNIVTTGMEGLKSEKIGDYSYQIREKTVDFLNNPNPYDLPIVNELIRPFKNTRPTLMVWDSNLNKGTDEDNLMATYKGY